MWRTDFGPPHRSPVPSVPIPHQGPPARNLARWQSSSLGRRLPLLLAATVATTALCALGPGCRRVHDAPEVPPEVLPTDETAVPAARSTDSDAGQDPGQDPGQPPPPPVSSVFRARQAPVAPSAKIFLVAASSQNANFAQEVVDQRELWLDAGFAADEIACYYTVPYQSELEADLDQFLALAPALSSCYPASVKLLFEHLAATADGPFLYLYVTAHGERPISQRLADARPGDDDYDRLLRRSRYPILDHYRLFFESLPDGTANSLEILGAYRAGVDARSLYFTPTHLAEMLSQRPPAQAKFVILQGCYSGGFIADPRARGSQVGLPAVSELTVLTAARPDRESFGCGHDDRHTYYGGAFLQALRQSLASPVRVNWRAVHDAVAARVAELEAELDVPASGPMFFSSRSGR